MSKSMHTALAGVVVIAVGRLAATGSLPRNRFAGIRIPSTMRSDAAWLAGHEAGSTALTVAGIGPVVVAIAGRVKTPTKQKQVVIGRLATAWMLGWIGLATYRANTAAHAINELNAAEAGGRADS